MAIRTEEVLPMRAQSYATSSSECGFSESISNRTAEARSLSVTPGSAICRTVTSSRGKRMVAARCPTPSFCKKAAYAAPHSAAGCSRKCGIVSSPSTRTPEGRSRTTVTVRSCGSDFDPDAGPEGEPFCKINTCHEICTSLQNAGVVVPAQDVERWIPIRSQQLDHGGNGAVQI